MHGEDSLVDFMVCRGRWKLVIWGYWRCFFLWSHGGCGNWKLKLGWFQEVEGEKDKVWVISEFEEEEDEVWEISGSWGRRGGSWEMSGCLGKRRMKFGWLWVCGEGVSSPPRQAPMASAKMRGLMGRLTSSSWLRLMRTGIWGQTRTGIRKTNPAGN